jgi:hypothetical protein
MRVRAHDMQQAADYSDPVAVVVTRPVVVNVFLIVIVRMAVIVMWAARAVHIIQHARENALPHINTYQRRALAN